MKSILIRDLPEQTLEKLKRLAEYHHRSLQGELHNILENASERAPKHSSMALRLNTVKTEFQGTWSREELYDNDAR